MPDPAEEPPTRKPRTYTRAQRLANSERALAYYYKRKEAGLTGKQNTLPAQGTAHHSARY